MHPVRLQSLAYKPVVRYISLISTATRITKPFLPPGPFAIQPSILLTVQKAVDSNPDKDRYPFDAVVTEKQIAELKPNELLVKINAVGFNHKM
ncbi:hypothetical protein FA13DRAFT_1806770 [Coprinellus micaceus]|uniref:Uncharacterized protein n=1 Tax=Coprinellus micaceus TaxID=71717 RepID=A0A4Y7RJS7_COPMI|nr:hypothetical protein FA13DRAFT_1806770 [Coprinellus micaceus]